MRFNFILLNSQAITPHFDFTKINIQYNYISILLNIRNLISRETANGNKK